MGEVRVGYRHRRNEVHRSFHRAGAEQERDRAGPVLQGNPAHDLRAAPDPPAKPELERRQHLLERAPAPAEHDTGSEVSHANVRAIERNPNIDLSAAPAGEGVDLHFQEVGKKSLQRGEAISFFLIRHHL